MCPFLGASEGLGKYLGREVERRARSQSNVMVTLGKSHTLESCSRASLHPFPKLGSGWTSGLGDVLGDNTRKVKVRLWSTSESKCFPLEKTMLQTQIPEPSSGFIDLLAAQELAFS